jgi:hypothetical protein
MAFENEWKCQRCTGPFVAPVQCTHLSASLRAGGALGRRRISVSVRLGDCGCGDCGCGDCGRFTTAENVRVSARAVTASLAYCLLFLHLRRDLNRRYLSHSSGSSSAPICAWLQSTFNRSTMHRKLSVAHLLQNIPTSGALLLVWCSKLSLIVLQSKPYDHPYISV